MRSIAIVLLLLPALLFGAAACGAEEAEPATVAAPTQAPVTEPAAMPDPTTSDAAPATLVSTEPETTVEPTAVPPTTNPGPAPTDAPTPQPTTAPATEEPTEVPKPEPVEGGPGPDSFIVGEGSLITFTVEEELNRAPVRFDAVISGSGLSGFANLDGSPSVITLDLHSLESDQSFRDRYIRDRMFPNTPMATVTVDSLPDLPQSFLDGEETEGTLDGTLQVGDTVTPLTFDVIARHDGSVINVLGKTTFTWEELGLGKPVFGPVAYLADEVRVQVLVVARVQ